MLLKQPPSYRNFLLLALFLITNSAVSHSQNKVSGKLLDSKNAPVPNAHVFFKNDQSSGTISNELGDFRLYVYSHHTEDTLMISILGYEIYKQPVSTLKEDLVIYMEESSFDLEEVTILSDSYLKKILKEAIGKIEYNYPTQTHRLRGYYQEYTISDTSYTEFIEADVTVETSSYTADPIRNTYYLNALRKSDDKRNLPERLKGMRNGVHLTYNHNNLLYRSFDYLPWQSNKFQDFGKELNSDKKLILKNKQILGQDTLLTIEYEDQVFTDMVYTLITINLSNKAITKLVKGNIWDFDDDFTEIHFREINGIHYPFYIKNVSQYEYNKKTEYHYSMRSLLFYEIESDQSQFKKYKRKQRMKEEKNIRDFKYQYDPEFWNSYIHSNKLSTTAIIKAELGRQRNLDEEFRQNQR